VPDQSLDQKDIDELNIRLNRNLGEWDFDILANQWDVDNLIEWGFTEEELSFDLDSVALTEPDNEILEPPKDPKTKLGDVFEMGNHCLVCGDSTIAETVERCFQTARPILMVTDPPYGISMDNGFSGSEGFGGKGKPIKRRQYKDEWDNDRPSKSTFDFLVSTSILSIIWGGNFFADILPRSTHWIVWDKKQTMPTFGDCELAWTNSNRKSVKKYEVEYNGLIGKEKERFHPTQKPIFLFSEIIKDYSEEKNSIFDPFLGSGTTLLACEQHERVCFAIELDPAYCDIAIERWVKYRKKLGKDCSVIRNGQQIEDFNAESASQSQTS
jgi:DNA modification methylase